MLQKVITDLHVALGQARAQQQAALDGSNLAEINLHKEIASRQLADGAMQRAQQELADASAERWPLLVSSAASTSCCHCRELSWVLVCLVMWPTSES